MFSKNYFYAVMVLIGTVTGAGIFAVPYVVAHAGVMTFLVYLPLLVAAQCLIHLLYAKVILSTKAEHRIPGYVGVYAGSKWKKVVAVITLVGGYGSLLAYVILGGTFAYDLLSPHWGGSLAVYVGVLYALEALIVLAGLKMFAGAESFLTGLLIVLFVGLTVKCLPHIELDNFIAVNWKEILLPYGPIFFALGGDAAIPEVCKLLEKEKQKIRSAILWGTILPAVLLMFFALAVVGVTGMNTTSDTLAGLKHYFGNGITTAALFFGLLCVVTSCLVYLQAVREIFWWDFKINKNVSWFLAASLPIILFFSGVQNITSVIGFTGMVSGGILGVVLILLTRAVDKNPEKKPAVAVKTSSWLAAVLCSLFILAFLSDLASLVIKRAL